MIKNDRQYKITQSEIRRFQAALETLREGERPDLLRQVQISALESQLASLEAEIREYDDLRNGVVGVLNVESFQDLPAAVIRARIASGLTQRDLAHAIGVKEQQIQRYEANDYAGVSFSRLQEIAEALGVVVNNRMFMPSSAGLKANLRRRLRDGGLDDRFIVNRFEPAGSPESAAYADLLGNVARVFEFSPKQLMSDEDLAPSAHLAMASGFKRPGASSNIRNRTYAIYARHLALASIRATPQLQSQPVPSTWNAFRAGVLHAHGTVNFESILRYVWSLGIVVLPLPDPGGFHGAFWRFGGRDVLVLKQGRRTRSRWTFDLLHECHHAASTTSPDGAVVDEEGMTDELENEELRANEFAGEVILAGRAEELAQDAVNSARGRLEWLKRAVIDLADGDLDTQEALANYLAWRLSLQGENWWATAVSLSRSGPLDAFEHTRSEFFRHVQLDLLDWPDRRLLENAFVEQ